MRHPLIAFALVTATTSACVINKGGDDDPDPDPTPDASMTPSSVIPKIGPWHYSEFTQVTSNCPSLIDEGQHGTFGIDTSSSTGFHVLPNDGTAPFNCTLTGAAFNCPNRAAFVEDYRPGVDAVVTVHATASGTFSSATRATGTQNATASCAGSACAAVSGQLPCMFSVNFTIEAL